MDEQIIVNIIIDVFKYLLIALSFVLIFNPTKYFHLAHAAVIAISPYLLYQFYDVSSLSLFLSLILSIFFSTILGISINQFIYKPMNKNKPTNMVYLITSLGIYIVLQNIISLLWGDDTKSLGSGIEMARHHIFNAYFSDVQAIIVLTGISIFFLIQMAFKHTQLGLKIRAISSNIDLAMIFGIKGNKVIMLSFLFGSILAAIAGILYGFDTNISPTMGFNYLLYGIVVMIIGGVGSIKGLLVGALILASAQHLGGYYLGHEWTQAIAFIILILFLIWKPLGFSGKQLKKTKI